MSKRLAFWKRSSLICIYWHIYHLSGAPHFFVLMQISVCYYFSSVWRTSFNMFYSSGLVLIEFFQFLCVWISLFHFHFWKLFHGKSSKLIGFFLFFFSLSVLLRCCSIFFWFSLFLMRSFFIFNLCPSLHNVSFFLYPLLRFYLYYWFQAIWLWCTIVKFSFFLCLRLTEAWICRFSLLTTRCSVNCEIFLLWLENALF